MLGEGFLSRLTYAEGSKDSAPSSPTSRTPLCRKPTHKAKLDSPARTQMKVEGDEEVPGLDPGLEQTRPAQPALAVLIPSDVAERHQDLELYRSWHCTSFCQNYPDLQLMGGPMVDRGPESCGGQYAVCALPPEAPPPGPAPLGPQAAPEPPRGDGYLEMNGSLALGTREPLSNSMLNSYMESMLLEVYRQHLQDSLARMGFPTTPALLPNVLLPSLDQLSSQLSLEQGLEAGLARNLVASYLSSARLTSSSSHFSTPVLRISNPDEGKKPL